MKISEQPTDRMVTNQEGDMIHCQVINVFSNPHDLAGWTKGGAARAYGYNQTTGEWIIDPDHEVLPWTQRRAILVKNN